VRLVRRREGVFLEHEGRSVPVDRTDLAYLGRMTPLGRKVYCRNKAKGLVNDGLHGESARTILQWWHLPARDWSFGPPQPAEEA
jgi:hypothetical protein